MLIQSLTCQATLAKLYSWISGEMTYLQYEAAEFTQRDFRLFPFAKRSEKPAQASVYPYVSVGKADGHGIY